MDENMGFEVDFPLFSKDLQSRENTLVELRGFIILYTSEKITLRGKLKLNRSDLNRLMFQLSNAEKIDP